MVAIPAACLLITLGAWVWSRETLLLLGRDIEFIQQNIILSNDVLTQNVDAETGTRGYVATRNSTFLEPYRRSFAALPSTLQDLEERLAPQPEQLDEFEMVKRLSQQNMGYLQQVINYATTQPSNQRMSAELMALLADGKQKMDGLRAAIAQFEQAEQEVLQSYSKQQDRVQNVTAALLWFTAIISALGTWAAIFLFSQVDKDLHDREERLKESRSLLQAIVSNVVDGVVTLDRRGKIDLFNPTAAVMFGYQPQEVIGQDLNLLLDQNIETENNLENSVQAGTARQTSGLRKDGSTFPIAISMSDVQLDDYRSIAIIRDMTEVQQIQENLHSRATELAKISGILAQTNLTLENRNQELEQFAYVASHDLKAPLRAIGNLSEWIEEDLQGQLPAENQHQMKLLRGRVHRMEDLIDGLLEYSRIGRRKTTVEAVNVRTMLTEVIDSLDPPASFTIDLAPELPTLTTKASPLRQVFANLISNAIKHHDRAAGHITISVTDLGASYEFAVADDGPGINPLYHTKIFTIFQTLQARDIKESTGIGLAIVKKIVETEGGTIRVESQVGSGATFYFTWLKQPLRREE